MYEKAQAYAAQGAIAGCAAAPTPQHSLSGVENQLMESIARVDSILSNVTAIADSLLGAEPDNAATGACQPCRCGRIGGFEDRHERLSYLLASLSFQVGRIERATQ